MLPQLSFSFPIHISFIPLPINNPIQIRLILIVDVEVGRDVTSRTLQSLVLSLSPLTSWQRELEWGERIRDEGEERQEERRVNQLSRRRVNSVNEYQSLLPRPLVST
jgi:hypothetical protein